MTAANVLTCKLCGRQGGALGWRMNQELRGVVCSDEQACAERQAQAGIAPATPAAPPEFSDLPASENHRPDQAPIVEVPTFSDLPKFAETAPDQPETGQIEPKTDQIEPESASVEPETGQIEPETAQEPLEPSSQAQESSEPVSEPQEASSVPQAPAEVDEQAPENEPHTCHWCGRRGRRGFEPDDFSPGAPDQCSNREACAERQRQAERMATKGQCVDCVREGITTRRKLATNGEGKPVPGPRCLTHHRVVRKRRRSTDHTRRIEAKYRITAEQYWALYDAFDGRCFVCGVATGQRKNLAVDHDHELAKGHDHPTDEGCENCIRCLACGPCNREVLGRLGVDALLRAVLVLTFPPAPIVFAGEPYDVAEYVSRARAIIESIVRPVSQPGAQYVQHTGWAPRPPDSAVLTQQEVEHVAKELGIPAPDEDATPRRPPTVADDGVGTVLDRMTRTQRALADSFVPEVDAQTASTPVPPDGPSWRELMAKNPGPMAMPPPEPYVFWEGVPPMHTGSQAPDVVVPPSPSSSEPLAHGRVTELGVVDFWGGPQGFWDPEP